MMGTLAGKLARKQIPTPPDRYRADVEGQIENVDGRMKITEIRVTYRLKVPRERADEAMALMPDYINDCPAAMSVTPCIRLEHSLEIEEMD